MGIARDCEGKLDDPDYISGLVEQDKAAVFRRNVFPFSMSIAAHEVLHLIGLVTGFVRIGGCGPQRYDCYLGEMKVERDSMCEAECEYAELTATAADLASSLRR